MTNAAPLLLKDIPLRQYRPVKSDAFPPSVNEMSARLDALHFLHITSHVILVALLPNCGPDIVCGEIESLCE